MKTDTLTTTSTNSHEFYTAPNLVPGNYEISTSATGFATPVVKDVTVTVGDQLTVNLTLRVGTVYEKVEVASLATPIDLASSALSNQVNSITVRELPLNGRDCSQLATLEAFWVPIWVLMRYKNFQY